MSIGSNIKRKRLELDMTLEELAIKIGTSRQTLSRYETGVITNIPSDKIEKLAIALKTTPAFLMGWEGNDNKPKNHIGTFKLNEGEYHHNGFTSKIIIVDGKPYFSLIDSNGNQLFEKDPETDIIDLKTNLDKLGLTMDSLATLLIKFLELSDKAQEKAKEYVDYLKFQQDQELEEEKEEQ